MDDKTRDMAITIGIAAGIVIIVTMALCLIATFMRSDEDVLEGVSSANSNLVDEQIKNSDESLANSQVSLENNDGSVIVNDGLEGNSKTNAFSKIFGKIVASNANNNQDSALIDDTQNTGTSENNENNDQKSGNSDSKNNPDDNDNQNNQDNNESEDDKNINNPEDNQDEKNKDKIVIAIDAAHQQKGDNDKEPIGPGSSQTKIKVSFGATGVSSGKPEYELTLSIALKLKAELIKRNYEIYMIREKNEVNISDSNRALLANENASAVIHIHGNATESEATKGVMAFSVSKENAFCKELSDECVKFSKALTQAIADETGCKNWGCILNDNLTALNYSKIVATHLEVGYMTNKEEDKLLHTEEYQDKIVKAIADGLDNYFER